MLTVADLSADALGSLLANDFRRAFGSSQAVLGDLLQSTARLALECIANSDALYHDLEHTMLVVQAGRDILRGRALREAVSPGDWVHFLVACLMHDIGYVRGVLTRDTSTAFVVDANGGTVTLPRGASDAALTPYHVDRSKLFVAERFSGSDLLDAARLCQMIEFTRFPAPDNGGGDGLHSEAMLVRAADLIGQLGDPHYLRKTNALFHEFSEIGVAARLNYSSPADLVESYPAFFWHHVSVHIEPALRHLDVTVDGRRWKAHLRANVYDAEHRGA